MKLLASLVCLAVAALVGVAAAGEKSTPNIEGTWIAIAGISEGTKVPDDDITKGMVTVVMKEGKYSVTVRGKEVETGSYKTDAAKKPATLDLSVATGKDAGKTQLGIYTFEGDKLNVAIAMAGKVRRRTSTAGPTSRSPC